MNIKKLRQIIKEAIETGILSEEPLWKRMARETSSERETRIWREDAASPNDQIRGKAARLVSQYIKPWNDNDPTVLALVNDKSDRVLGGLVMGLPIDSKHFEALKNSDNYVVQHQLRQREEMEEEGKRMTGNLE